MTGITEKLRKYYIRTYRELYDTVDSRLRSAQIPPPPRKKKDKNLYLKNTLLAKLGIAYNTIDDELRKLIEGTETIEKNHPFYQEIFIMRINESPGKIAKTLRITRRNMRRIYLEYRARIKTAPTPETAVSAFKSGLGRLLSFYKRIGKLALGIKEVIKEITKLPDITGELVVIVTGMPQVGKSTLIKTLTRAEPEIANYPFTTKTIIVGHIDVDKLGKIVLVDTPGLLDRPLEEKNIIEKKAVIALKHLADKALFMVDASPQSYYSIDEQLSVYYSVAGLVGDENTLVLINKTDITPKETLQETTRLIEEKTGKQPLMISALTGDGLEELVEILRKWFMEKIQNL